MAVVTNPKIDRQIKLADLATPFQNPPVTILKGAARQEAEDAPSDYADDLTDLCQYFEEAEDMTQDARKLSERDRDYVDHDQWTSEELAILRKRKQPAITDNQVARKVETLRGYERRMRSDPKAFPRNPQDEQTAGAATDALRFVADQNDFDVIRSSVYDNLLVEGYSGADVTIEVMPNGEKRVDVQYVPWDRLIYDPHARKSDFSDGRYKGIVIWMDGDEAREKWPEAADAIDSTFKSVTLNDTYGDRPGSAWCDTKRKRVRVVQMHYKRGDEWRVATYTKGGFLEEPVPSPYVDKYGQTVSSLVLRSAYIDRKNNRYGAVRGMISLQDEINKRRSKLLHLLSVRQTFGNKAAIADTQAARIELAKPDGHVDINAGAEFGKDFGVLPTTDMAQGQMQLLQMTMQQMSTTGPSNAMAGKGNQSQSGRAWEAQQQAGAVEMEPLVDELRQWTRDVYEQIWMRIRQYWTEQVWVRVTDDDRNVKFVGLNKQVTLEDKLMQTEPALRAQYMQQIGLVPGDPRLQEVIEVENDVSGLDVDIVVEEGPSVVNLQSEQFQMLAELAKNGIGIPPKAIIQASSLRNKEQLLDEMEKGQQLPPEVQKQMQEMQQELQRLTQENQQLTQDRSIDLAKLALENKKVDKAAAQGPEQPTSKDAAEARLKEAQAVKTMAEAEQTRIETIQMQTQLNTEGVGTEQDPETGEVMPAPPTEMQQVLAAVAQLAAVAAAPKRIVRDPNTGELLGTEPVMPTQQPAME